MAGYGSGFSRYATKKEGRKESAFDRYDSKKDEGVPDYLSALKQAMRQNPYGLLADEMVRSGYFDRVNKYSREGLDYVDQGVPGLMSERDPRVAAAQQTLLGGSPYASILALGRDPEVNIPKIGLGALGYATAPINAAAAPIVEPLMQPIASAVNDVTGRSLEQLSGYPAELTTGLAMALLPGNKEGMKAWTKPTIKDTGPSLTDAIRSRAFMLQRSNPNWERYGSVAKHKYLDLAPAARDQLFAEIASTKDKRFSRVNNPPYNPNTDALAKNSYVLQQKIKRAAAESEKKKIFDSIPMMRHFTSDRLERINRDFSFGGLQETNAEGALAAVEAITREARKRGWKVEHTSKSKDGRVSSRYIIVPGKGKIRVSDHYLPDTAQRSSMRSMGIGGKWDDEIVTTDWKSETLENYMKRLEETSSDE